MTQAGHYAFLPWLRNGIANTISAADGSATVKTRASVHVALRLSGQPADGGASLTQDIGQDIALYGPGDVVGIDARAIVRTEPKDWSTNFESNYLAAVDFYDEDFPWRYTPAAAGAPDANGGSDLQLRPWIALAVLEESEFAEAPADATHPRPYITIPDTSMLPASAELWAWAHVHFNESLGANDSELVSTDMGAVLPRMQAALAADPDVAYSRLVCPRRLKQNTAYHAFVVPTFEPGRLAGLSQDPSLAPYATFGAWDTYAAKPEPASFPVYFRWSFRTGALGDFEYLVGLLRPQPVDPAVGTRDLDVQFPGSGIPGITDPPGTPTDKKLGGILPLGGALRVPDADLTPEQLAVRQKYDAWDQQTYPVGFEKKLAAFVNLPDDYAAADAKTANAATEIGPGVSDDPDPLITPPLYGRWHALTRRLLYNRDGSPVDNRANWVHRLNLDPRYRVAAGLGADVVEQNAEAYMNAAWEQVGDVLAANQRVRRLHFASAVSTRWFDAHLKPLAATNPERAYGLAAPTAARVVAGGITIAWAQRASTMASTLTTPAFRRAVRPGARLMGALPFGGGATPTNLLARVNAGAVSAAPPKATPAGVATVDQVGANVAAHSGVPAWLANLLRRFPWLPIAVLVIAVVVALVILLLLPGVGIAIAIAVLVGGWFVYRALLRAAATDAVVQALDPTHQTPAAVAALPNSSDFQLSTPGSAATPTVSLTDSPTAARFKTGLRDAFGLMQATTAVDALPRRAPVDLPALTAAAVGALDPRTTILNRGLSSITRPAWVLQGVVDPWGEVMAYPKIDLPMYRPLKARSIEFLLPNINLIPPNSITLLETNRKFVEAYLLGTNFELARKLLWREYPTDQRGSYFRQFWDPAPYLDTKDRSPADLREQLYDIPPIHEWPPTSNLGAHSNPPNPDGKPVGEDAVLVIRGELLKRYPRAVIYAHRAQWQTNASGGIDITLPRVLVPLTDKEAGAPPREKVRTPLYEAKADPDIYFFGFDLMADEARGGPGTSPADDPGWFFVIKERPGEPRFGLELTRSGAPQLLGELTWDDAMPGGSPGQNLSATALSGVVLAPATGGDPDRADQHDDDVLVNGATRSAAQWAYLLLRSPVMVAVHAMQLLGRGCA
jgi:hypothetical protein